MLTSLNRLTGMPVVWRDRQVGCVERAVADMRCMRLQGLVVRRGFAGARWVAREMILTVGRQSVVIVCRPGRMPQQETEGIRRVVLASGSCAGEVSDVILRSDTLGVAALEVSQGPLYRLAGRRAYAPGCLMNGAGEAVAPQLISWTQLLTLLGEGENA